MFDDDEFTSAPGHRLAHFEDCQAAIDQLFSEALATKGSNAFDEFLKFAARFSNLSIYNAMLVSIQRRGAVAVASRAKWRQIGRWLKPDAVPIVILRPFGPVAFVYDQDDTEGEPLPGADRNPLFAKGSLSKETYERTCKAAGKYEIDVQATDQYGTLLAGTAAGFSKLPEVGRVLDDKSAKRRRGFRIKLNAKHDLPTRFATLAHELGHVYCGHVGEDGKGRWPERSNLSPQLKELEAEAVAWLVCERNGVKTKSNEYLSDLMNGADLSAISMYSIFEAANRVESRTPPA